MEVGEREVAAHNLLGHLERVAHRVDAAEAHPPAGLGVAADEDHLAHVLKGVGAQYHM